MVSFAGFFIALPMRWMTSSTQAAIDVYKRQVVSFATTMPEMMVSVFAAYEGNADIAGGNAVGSVTANTGLIMRCV